MHRWHPGGVWRDHRADRYPALGTLQSGMLNWTELRRAQFQPGLVLAEVVEHGEVGEVGEQALDRRRPAGADLGRDRFLDRADDELGGERGRRRAGRWARGGRSRPPARSARSAAGALPRPARARPAPRPAAPSPAAAARRRCAAAWRGRRGSPPASSRPHGPPRALPRRVDLPPSRRPARSRPPCRRSGAGSGRGRSRCAPALPAPWPCRSPGRRR